MKIDPDKVPLSVNEAIDMCFNAMTESEREIMAETDSSLYHHSLGQYLRNEWSMWEMDTPLQLDFQKKFGLFGHADDVSSIILLSVQAKITGKNIDELQRETVKRYKAHWEAFGLNPVDGTPATTGQPLTNITLIKFPKPKQ